MQIAKNIAIIIAKKKEGEQTMTKEKRTLQKEIYVRLYDKKIVDKYNEVKSSKRSDVSDNEFAQELIALGLKVLSPSREDSK